MLIHYDQTVRIKRQKVTSGSKRALVATATADVSLQSLGRDRGQIQDGVFGSTFVAYMESDVPCQKGDRLIDADGVHYDVTDVIIRDFGAFPHKEAVLKKTQ